MAGGEVTGAAVRNDPPDPDDWGMVVRVIGGIIVVGPLHVIVDSSALPAGAATEATLEEISLLSPASVRSSVMAAPGDTLLAAANPARKQLVIYNHSNSLLYVGLGVAPVTSLDFTFIIAGSTEWRPPERFVGEVRGFWAVADGVAMITELT